jgi:hypothetical protein
MDEKILDPVSITDSNLGPFQTRIFIALGEIYCEALVKSYKCN